MKETMKKGIAIERTYKAEPEELWALWTTKEGFESWWGPEEFRADVHRIEAQFGGALHYDMVADTPAMVTAMKNVGAPTSTQCRGTFSEFRPHERLALTQVIDFLPGVQPYESRTEVDFIPAPDGHVRMMVTLSQMHDTQTTKMQQKGFTSQFAKLDRRYGWKG